MPKKVVLVGLLLWAGCPNNTPAGSALVSEVRRALAEREKRLSSYHLVAASKEGEAIATHAFFFRSPNKMRGVVLQPANLEWSYDGQHLYKLEPTEKKFSSFEMKLPAEKAAMFLTTTFAPFVTEGFRTPLMPSKGVTATRVPHPKGPEAVELKVEAGAGVTVTYTLRWPTADFLHRRTEAGGQLSELKVDEELCDEKLRLCVPKVSSEYLDGKLQLTTRLTTIELNAEVPADDFAPAAPEGWARESHQVVESD
jgi:outer membrane lipoprotein-sorting protein